MKLGRVYKIIHHQSNIVYVGSTFNELRHRFYHHKANLGTSCISKYIKKYGKKNFTIMLIKEYQVCDRKHLNAWEQFWINKLNCINEKGCISILHKNKYMKIYRKKNKEIIKEKKMIFYQKNSILIKEKSKKYYEKNKDKILQKKKIYREKNGGQIFCEVCKCNTSKLNYNRHIKTKKHLHNLNKIKMKK